MLSRTESPGQRAVVLFGRRGLPLLLFPLLFAAPAARAIPADTRIETRIQGQLLDLAWQDVEDRLQGSITPYPPKANQPFTVSVRVGTFQGAQFEGPVTFTLRKVGEEQGPTVTVEKDDGAWKTSFTPAEAGAYRVDVGFLTQRRKVLGADFSVQPAPIGRMMGGILLGVALLVAAFFGIRAVRRQILPSAPAPDR